MFDNGKDFPQISSWLRASRDLFLCSPLHSSVATGHVYPVNQPLAQHLRVTAPSESTEWEVEIFLESAPTPGWLAINLLFWK